MCIIQIFARDKNFILAKKIKNFICVDTHNIIKGNNFLSFRYMNDVFFAMSNFITLSIIYENHNLWAYWEKYLSTNTAKSK